MEDRLTADLIQVLRASPRVMAVLEVVRQQRLPDPLLFSGAVYQTVWNAVTGRPPDYGIQDYDVGYFDGDVSFDAEDLVIRRVAGALSEPLVDVVEVRNQARVHLWFPAKFGHPYEPLTRTAEALERFVCPAFAVGLSLQGDGSMSVEAPFGLDDVFAMRLRVNPLRGVAADWDRIVGSARARWPELTVEVPA